MNDPNPPLIIGILYGRVSTDKQDVERQERMMPEYCARNNILAAIKINDPDTSGSIPFTKRVGGLRVLAELKAKAALGPVALVTTEQDRIGRDTVDIISTIRAVWDCGAIPHFVAEGGPLERTPENELKMGLKASVAQYERDKIRQRIRSKFKTKRDYGELCGAVSFGWDAKYVFADGFELISNKALSSGQGKDKDDALAELIGQHGKLISQMLVDNPEEQKWILHVKRLRDAGWGFHSIAKNLNELGVPTKRGAGEIMQLRNEDGNTEASSKRFVTGKWQCGNVAKLFKSKTIEKWLADQAQACRKVA